MVVVAMASIRNSDVVVIDSDDRSGSTAVISYLVPSICIYQESLAAAG